MANAFGTIALTDNNTDDPNVEYRVHPRFKYLEAYLNTVLNTAGRGSDSLAVYYEFESYLEGDEDLTTKLKSETKPELGPAPEPMTSEYYQNLIKAALHELVVLT